MSGFQVGLGSRCLVLKGASISTSSAWLLALHLRAGLCDCTGIQSAAAEPDAWAVLLQVCDEPRVYILDTPGVTLPNLKTEEIALKLAIIGEQQGSRCMTRSCLARACDAHHSAGGPRSSWRSAAALPAMHQSMAVTLAWRPTLR